MSKTILRQKEKTLFPEESDIKKIRVDPKKSRINNHQEINKNEVEEGLERLKNDILENKAFYKKLGIISFISSVIFSGTLIQSLRYSIGAQKAIYISHIPKWAFSPIGILLIIILMTIAFGFQFRFFRAIEVDYVTDTKRGIDISKKGTYGVANWQTEDERKECFYRSRTIDKLTHNQDILGYDDNGFLYALRDDLFAMNKNVAILGAPGAGKSAALVINDIYQNILRGESIIVTDSKGDLYRDTAYVAKKHNYKVKVLNLKAGELKNSDGCDFLKMTRGDDADAKALTIANTIISNTEGDKRLDYWAKNELNYLKALILYVVTSPRFKADNSDNLAGLYNYCTTHSLDDITVDFMKLKPHDPARMAFNIFSDCKTEIQGQISNGLKIRLQTLGNRYMQKIVASDEIDLLAPMKERCIYYVIISDTDSTYKFIATLFFAELFMGMCDYSDSLTKAEKKKQLAVNFLLDEFANTGAIPDFVNKVTTVRSRKIGIKIILQDIGQLESMYPSEWRSILNGMATKIYLSSNDENTAKYFSNLLGTMTVRMENKRYAESADALFHTHEEAMISEGLGKRALMTPDELINDLSSDDLVVLISKRHPVMLHKYISENHPMDAERFVTKKIRQVNKKTGEIRERNAIVEQELPPSKHIPEWRREMEQYDEERRKKEAQTQEFLEKEREKRQNEHDSEVKKQRDTYKEYEVKRKQKEAEALSKKKSELENIIRQEAATEARKVVEEQKQSEEAQEKAKTTRTGNALDAKQTPKRRKKEVPVNKPKNGTEIIKKEKMPVPPAPVPQNNSPEKPADINAAYETDEFDDLAGDLFEEFGSF